MSGRTRHPDPVRRVPHHPRFAAELADLTVDEARRRARLVDALPPGAALCRRSAAREHGIDLLMPDERDVPARVQCLLPSGQVPLRRVGVQSFASDLRPEDVVRVRGLPVTGRDRTFLDIARFEREPLALAVLDRGLRSGLFHPASLLQRLEDMPRQRGVARAKRLVRLADAGAESPGESWCRLRVVDARFEVPETQIEVPRPGHRYPYRLDMGWRERRKALEYDGVEDHSSPASRAHDARRRAWIESQGWSVLVVGKGEVLGVRLALEHAVGELLGEAPRIGCRSW